MSLEERMYALIKECEASGLSQKAFCLSKQIKLPTFQYWRQKQKRAAQNNFVPILANKSVPDTGSIEVVYPNGTTVRLNHFDLHQIVQLLNLR